MTCRMLLRRTPFDRSHGQLAHLAMPQELEPSGLPDAAAVQHSHEIVDAGDRHLIESEDHVSGRDAGASGRRVGFDGDDHHP